MIQQRKGGDGYRTVVLAILAFLALAGTALAYWEQKKETINLLTMGSYQTEIVEQYKIPSAVNPSQQVEKKVSVKNSGTVDVLVRMLVERSFGTKENGAYQKDKSLDGNMIQICFHSDYWKQGADGWFYYKEILKAGETTKEPLMDSFCLSEQAGNEYMGKEAHITVTMESIQAEANAADIWGEEIKKVKIHWPDVPEGKETVVEYCGREKGFEISGRETDLFAAFKNLTPGCGRTQKIRIKNSSGEKADLYLHGEEMQQSEASAEQASMVSELLQKYAQLELKDGETVLYKGTVGGSVKANPADHKISLGSFDAGQEKVLTAGLSLSPEMDNRFQKLTGKVKWVFTARGEDGKNIAAAVPITGDDTDIRMWILLIIICGAILFPAVKKERQ